MKRYLPLLLLVAVLMAAYAYAEPTEPPTRFEGGYTKPIAGQAPPPSVNWQYIDAGVLAAALLLTGVFLHALRSRLAVMLVMAAALGYFGFYRHGCICAVGSIQNIALALGGQEYAVPLMAIVTFGLPLLVAMFFGRLFCGGACPLGAIQDIVLLKALRVPAWLDSALRLLASAYLVAAVTLAGFGAAFLICQYDPFVGLFRLSATKYMLIFGGAVLALSVVIGRPYCRWLCPYGVLLGAASWLSKQAVKITPSKCVKCRLCEKACPFGAIQAPTEPVAAGERKGLRLAMAAALVSVPVLAGAGVLFGMWVAPAVSQVHPYVQHETAIAKEGVTLASLGPAPTRTTTRPAGTASRPAGMTSRPAGATTRPASGVNAGAITRPAAGGAPRATTGLVAGLPRGLARYYLQNAPAICERANWACAVGGGVLGLLLGGRLVMLSRRPRREFYQVDRVRCVSCGRCLKACPMNRKKQTDDLKVILDKTPVSTSRED